jgi:hypothetical protein
MRQIRGYYVIRPEAIELMGTFEAAKEGRGETFLEWEGPAACYSCVVIPI